MASPGAPPALPRLLFAVVRPIRAFFRTQAASGIVLIVSAAVAVWLANSWLGHAYRELLESDVVLGLGARAVRFRVHELVNDGLMTFFFTVAGMEIKRELVTGELNSVRRALLPAVAALGGMVVPALIHFSLNHGGSGRPGWGVPMATDIAFAVGCLALAAGRVPSSVIVFLLALAIFDDLGAIAVIALFYGGDLHPVPLAVAGGVTLALILLARWGVKSLTPFVVLGITLWAALLPSGIHATIAGVVLGLTLPATGRRSPESVLDDLEVALGRLRSARGTGLDGGAVIAAVERHLEDVQAPLERLQHGLHGFSAFAVMPLFALANAGVEVAGLPPPDVRPAFWGVAAGLVLGKPVGIFLVTRAAVALGFAPRPTGASWGHVFAASVLAGIGFTMSIFVATLAFADTPALVDASKTGVFLASLVCAPLGVGLFYWLKPPAREADDAEDLQVTVDVPVFAEGYRVRTWPVAPWASAQTLRQLALPKRFGVMVVGRFRDAEPGNRRLEPVGADTIVSQGEGLLVVGEAAQVDALLGEDVPEDAAGRE